MGTSLMGRFRQFVEVAGKKMKPIIKPLGISFSGSVLLGLLWFLSIARVPGEHHECVVIGIVVCLWTICLTVAAARQPMSTQLVTAMGSTWGFTFLLVVFVSGNKWGHANVSIYWPATIPALLIIPFLILVTTFPVYLISTWIYKRSVDMNKLAIGLLGLCIVALPMYSHMSDKNTKAGMVLIPAGTFMMGSPSDELDRHSDEGPQHQVMLTQGFYVGKYEVTVGQYATFLEATGKESGVDWNDNGCPLSRSDGRYTLRDSWSWDQPMMELSWYGAAMYCNYLSEQEGLESVYNLDTWEVDWSANGFRLPTEAEWEYACRAGTQTRFYWGNDPSNKARQDIPNAFGLYDMSANVYEWCQDWYGEYSDSNQTDPIGPSSGLKRVLRGGFRDDSPRHCRSAHRYKNLPDTMHGYIGFRVLRSNP